MTEPEYRCGFAALVGRPNTGKSTLLNALVQHELSIVTPKPQTTRHRILGIRSAPDWQIVFVDTPGMHRGEKRALNRFMNRTAAHAISDADVQLLVVEALSWRDEDEDVLERAVAARGRVVLVVNKVDLIRPRARLLPFLERIAEKADFAAVVPVSARRKNNLEQLEQVVADQLPVSPPMYPVDQLTDRTERFLAAELIREKLTMRLDEELPYGLSVEIEEYAEREGVLHVGAIVWVERKGHKPIVLGKGGERAKAVSTAARLALKERVGKPVYLRFWVKVKENWSDSEHSLRTFGYDVQ